LEKKISDLMDFLQDDSVALAPRGVASSVKIKEAVMEKLHMEKSTVKAKPKLTRTALIAAVVAMVLSVAAFAVYRYSLRYLVSSVPEDGKTTLTLSGYQDSNEYRAAEEWEKYLRQTTLRVRRISRRMKACRSHIVISALKAARWPQCFSRQPDATA